MAVSVASIRGAGMASFAVAAGSWNASFTSGSAPFAPGAGRRGPATSTSALSPSTRPRSSIRSFRRGHPTHASCPLQARMSSASRSSGCVSPSRSRRRWGSSTRRSSATRCWGPTIHHKPWIRPRRRTWPWEALCWAITEQLIEGSRAAEIQRRIVRRWAPSYVPPDHPTPKRGSGPMAPARRALGGGDRRAGPRRARLDGPEPGTLGGDGALRAGGRPRAERDSTTRTATGGCSRSPRSGPGRSSASGCTGAAIPTRCRRAISPTSSWSGHLAGLGRRATVEEVEEYFAPYAPFRGLAGSFALAGWHKAMGAGPPARLAA